MVNCVAADVRRIISTGLEDADITALIVLADAEMTSRGMNYSTSNSKTISALLTASLIALRDPKSSSIGDYSETNRDPLDWRNAAENIIHRISSPALLAYYEPSLGEDE